MNKKQLTEAIRDGMTQNRETMLNDLNKAIWGILGIIVLGLILFFTWSQYHEWRYPSPPMQVSEQSCFPYKNLNCNIYEEERYFKCNDGLIHETAFYIETQEDSNISSFSTNVNDSIFPCADISNQIPLRTKSICGYQEANAWFSNFKLNYPEPQFKLRMECN